MICTNPTLLGTHRPATRGRAGRIKRAGSRRAARASTAPPHSARYRKGSERPDAGCRAGTCNPATTKYPHTTSFLERPEKGGAVELRRTGAADGARFRQLARHLRSPALAHDKLGLSVGGDDQLLAFRQAIHQAGIVVELADRNGLHNSVKHYRLTLQSCKGKRQKRQKLASSQSGVQVDHAGPRASAAGRSSCTSLRYC